MVEIRIMRTDEGTTDRPARPECSFAVMPREHRDPRQSDEDEADGARGYRAQNGMPRSPGIHRIRAIASVERALSQGNRLSQVSQPIEKAGDEGSSSAPRECVVQREA